jgi:hypothetical protein
MLSDAIAAADSCVPVWMMIFFFSNLYMIHFILTAGVECNEIIDGQVRSARFFLDIVLVHVGI